MREAVFQVMDSWGSIGIFLLILIENLFPPIPSEVILTFGGFMTTYTAMTAGEVIAAATAGSVAGAAVLYGAGRLATPSRLERFLGGRVGTLLHFRRRMWKTRQNGLKKGEKQLCFSAGACRSSEA